LSYFF